MSDPETKAKLAEALEDLHTLKVAMVEHMTASYVQMCAIRLLAEKAGISEKTLKSLEDEWERGRRIYSKQMGLPPPDSPN